ncbi:hypothetical protein [Nonomuraea gerenzanensis]|uniref:Secreted protein n=1 Tax=Nonomuraea gerenzanensis TaxID=93944 RepID=A0A1M4EDL9_9ACTN|nr:hypothetical protein [Nonomuraea gerenzanensis]UBU08424.1 hypothetical protein LCN96_28950 [Nonomuraea gerenzanensis]SBO96768.1 hypothetical protein BN4615_P6284 [Nonomuraea gerenzanensis]
MRSGHRRTRAGIFALALTTAMSSAVLQAGPAHADPAPYYCGNWAVAGGFDYRACVEINPGSIGHVLEVKRVTGGSLLRTLVYLQRQVNGRNWNWCEDRAEDFEPYEFKTFRCYSTRTAGSTYRTRGATGGAAYAYSPTVRG